MRSDMFSTWYTGHARIGTERTKHDPRRSSSGFNRAQLVSGTVAIVDYGGGAGGCGGFGGGGGGGGGGGSGDFGGGGSGASVCDPCVGFLIDGAGMRACVTRGICSHSIRQTRSWHEGKLMC